MGCICDYRQGVMDPSQNDEAPKDPGAKLPVHHQGYTEDLDEKSAVSNEKDKISVITTSNSSSPPSSNQSLTCQPIPSLLRRCVMRIILSNLSFRPVFRVWHVGPYTALPERPS
uniref:Uncharacterized protein n=1 Tax=Timema douglasi TaxID=61478 RepID=A0A7R8VBA5_TIMDO|nr:unnamed protein product [Timema douglasi]